METAGRKLWANTSIWGHKIPIYILPRKEMKCSGATFWERGKCEIYIAEERLKSARLDGLLMHEFVHVVEYLNDPSCLSPELVDECTPLAQVMGEGLTQLLKNLKQAGDKAAR